MTETATRIGAPLIAELEQEAVTTRRLLERLPAGKLTWKPHAKSMTLGQLALHVAGCLKIIGFVDMEGIDVNTMSFEAKQPENAGEIMKAFEENRAGALKRLEALDERQAGEMFRLHKGGLELLSFPKAGLVRSLVFNHLYHHRGQLTVYLRLLDVDLPVVYGRTADENPFA